MQQGNESSMTTGGNFELSPNSSCNRLAPKMLCNASNSRDGSLYICNLAFIIRP